MPTSLRSGTLRHFDGCAWIRSPGETAAGPTWLGHPRRLSASSRRAPSVSALPAQRPAVLIDATNAKSQPQVRRTIAECKNPGRCDTYHRQTPYDILRLHGSQEML